MTGNRWDLHRILKDIYFRDFAKEISETISIPTVICGDIKEYCSVEKLLNKSNIDLFFI